MRINLRIHVKVKLYLKLPDKLKQQITYVINSNQVNSSINTLMDLCILTTINLEAQLMSRGYGVLQKLS
jgi:hypothetical protein